MNLLGLVFSIVLILSYASYACFDKQVSSHRLRSSYQSHQKANRKILNSYQSKVYQNLRSGAKPAKKVSQLDGDEDADEMMEQEVIKPQDVNRECARLNLWHLVQNGREENEELYQLTAKLLSAFYTPLFPDKKRYEYKFLDALLKTLKTAMESDNYALEKLKLPNPEMQIAYYHMLRGTKKSMRKDGGYPSLLEYIKVESTKDKICVHHAHLDLLTVLLGPKAAKSLYEEIHKQERPMLTKELMERICRETHTHGIDEALFTLLEFGYKRHQEQKKVFVAEDRETGVSLKKNLYLKARSS